jgi:hypothetical protein
MNLFRPPSEESIPPDYAGVDFISTVRIYEFGYRITAICVSQYEAVTTRLLNGGRQFHKQKDTHKAYRHSSFVKLPDIYAACYPIILWLLILVWYNCTGAQWDCFLVSVISVLSAVCLVICCVAV